MNKTQELQITKVKAPLFDAGFNAGKKEGRQEAQKEMLEDELKFLETFKWVTYEPEFYILIKKKIDNRINLIKEQLKSLERIKHE